MKPASRWGLCVALFAWSGLVLTGGCADPQASRGPETSPQQAWTERPGSSVFWGDAGMPGAQDERDRQFAAYLEQSGQAADGVPRAYLPRQALMLVHSFLEPQARYEQIYDHLCHSSLQARVSRDRFVHSMQPEYYFVVRLLTRLAMFDSQDVVAREDRRRRQAMFAIRPHMRRQLKRDELWGVSFAWEDGGWKLTGFFPDIFDEPDEPASQPLLPD